jgi:hypothetical protein
MSDELTLWVVRASDNETLSELTYVYARDEEHARELAQGWFTQYPYLPYHYFRAFPSGFRVGGMREQYTRLPGHTPTTEER